RRELAASLRPKSYLPLPPISMTKRPIHHGPVATVSSLIARPVVHEPGAAAPGARSKAHLDAKHGLAGARARVRQECALAGLAPIPAHAVIHAEHVGHDEPDAGRDVKRTQRPSAVVVIRGGRGLTIAADRGTHLALLGEAPRPQHEVRRQVRD